MECENGKVQDKGMFYGCTGYHKGCNFTLPKTFLGKKLTETHIKALLSGKKTRLIKGFKSKKGRDFDVYLIMKDGKLSFEFPKKK